MADVVFNHCHSSQFSISCGVPQGSILRPLLFSLYVNDMVIVSFLLFPILFADDTNILLNSKNMSDLFHIMNIELKKIVEWLYVNNFLSMLINYMLFGLSKKRIITDEVLYINNEIITNFKSVTILEDQHNTILHFITPFISYSC